jgi:hypothetical protein
VGIVAEYEGSRTVYSSHWDVELPSQQKMLRGPRPGPGGAGPGGASRGGQADFSARGAATPAKGLAATRFGRSENASAGRGRSHVGQSRVGGRVPSSFVKLYTSR